MELKVWVNSVQRVVCGVTTATTCQDVIIALAQAMGRTGRFNLVERWRGAERPLAAGDSPVTALQKWGEYAHEIKFVLRESAAKKKKEPTRPESNASQSHQHRSATGAAVAAGGADRGSVPKQTRGAIRKSLSFSGATFAAGGLTTPPVRPQQGKSQRTIANVKEEEEEAAGCSSSKEHEGPGGAAAEVKLEMQEARTRLAPTRSAQQQQQQLQPFAAPRSSAVKQSRSVAVSAAPKIEARTTPAPGEAGGSQLVERSMVAVQGNVEQRRAVPARRAALSASPSPMVQELSTAQVTDSLGKRLGATKPPDLKLSLQGASKMAAAEERLPAPDNTSPTGKLAFVAQAGSGDESRATTAAPVSGIPKHALTRVRSFGSQPNSGVSTPTGDPESPGEQQLSAALNGTHSVAITADARSVTRLTSKPPAVTGKDPGKGVPMSQSSPRNAAAARSSAMPAAAAHRSHLSGNAPLEQRNASAALLSTSLKEDPKTSSSEQGRLSHLEADVSTPSTAGPHSASGSTDTDTLAASSTAINGSEEQSAAGSSVRAASTGGHSSLFRALAEEVKGQQRGSQLPRSAASTSRPRPAASPQTSQKSTDTAIPSYTADGGRIPGCSSFSPVAVHDRRLQNGGTAESHLDKTLPTNVKQDAAHGQADLQKQAPPAISLMVIGHANHWDAKTYSALKGDTQAEEGSNFTHSEEYDSLLKVVSVQQDTLALQRSRLELMEKEIAAKQLREHGKAEESAAVQQLLTELEATCQHLDRELEQQGSSEAEDPATAAELTALRREEARSCEALADVRRRTEECDRSLAEHLQLVEQLHAHLDACREQLAQLSRAAEEREADAERQYLELLCAEEKGPLALVKAECSQMSRSLQKAEASIEAKHQAATDLKPQVEKEGSETAAAAAAKNRRSSSVQAGRGSIAHASNASAIYC